MTRSNRPTKGRGKNYRKRLKALDRAVAAATERLRAGVQEAYPIGARVHVRLGRAEVVGIVEGYGSASSRTSAEEVWIRNEQTGKVRRFAAVYHRTTVLTLPGGVHVDDDGGPEDRPLDFGEPAAPSTGDLKVIAQADDLPCGMDNSTESTV